MTAGEGLDGDEAGVAGGVGVGDELEFEAGGFLGDGGHAKLGSCAKKTHRHLQACTSIVMIRVKEFEIAKRRALAGTGVIVPIVVRACRFDTFELGQLQAFYPGAKPIKQPRHRDAAWLEVTQQLDRVIKAMKVRRQQLVPPKFILPGI